MKKFNSPEKLRSRMMPTPTATAVPFHVKVENPGKPPQIANSNIFVHSLEGQLIGEGGSSQVYNGYYCRDPTKFKTTKIKAAVKCIDCGNDHEDINRALDKCVQEIDLWTEITGENDERSLNKYILTFYDTVIVKAVCGDGQDDDPNLGKITVYIAIELASCTLERFWEKNPHPQMDTLRKYLSNMADAVEYLHSRDIIHRDIKPQNLFVFENSFPGIVKLGDFGLSVKLVSEDEKDNGILTESKGTQKWMSPEAFEALQKGEHFLNTKSLDIFSLGFTWHFCAVGGDQSEYYQKYRSLESVKNWERGPIHFIYWADMRLNNLVMWMMSKDGRKRPTIQQVKDHPYFWEDDKVVEFFGDVVKCFEDWWGNVYLRRVAICMDIAYEELYVRINNRKRIPWTDEKKLAYSYLKKYLRFQLPAGGRSKYFNGRSVISFLKFIVELARKSEDVEDDLVGEDAKKFCREKSCGCLLNFNPDLVILIFCGLSRICQDYEYFKPLENKYFKDFIGSFVGWTDEYTVHFLDILVRELDKRKTK